MKILARKFATFRQVARTGGVRGVLRAAVWNYAQPIPGYGRVAQVAASALAAPEAIRARREHGVPPLVLAFFGGIGDELLLTAVVHELRRRDHHGTWVMSEHPDLWRDNAGRDVVLPWDRRHAAWVGLFGWNAIYPYYTRYISEGDRDVAPARHIITLMCERAGIIGSVAHKPRIVLSPDELERGALVPDQVAIQSSGLNARFPVKTKQWFPDRYQAVVDALSPHVNFVQVGSRSDPPLKGALDLRGKTSIRETAAILGRSLGFVGQVGMLMHLARAVDCRSTIVYGGREQPWQTGYSCNENLYNPVECSPCWKVSTCGHHLKCLRQIEASDVVHAVERQLARYGQPVELDTDMIAAEAFSPRTAPDGRVMVTVTDAFGNRREIEAKLPRTSDAAAFGRRSATPTAA